MAQAGRRISRSCQVLVTIGWGTTVLSAGCVRDECTPQEQRCDGAILMYCERDNFDPGYPAYWHRAPCSVACREAHGEAKCVSAPQPVPECANAARLICYGGAPSSCWDGYPVAFSGCDSGTHCVETEECGPTCTSQDNPDPRCAGRREYCDGDDTVICACGFEYRRVVCSVDGNLCHEVNDSARCTPPTQDARCGDPAQETSGFCADGWAYTCWYGYVTWDGGLPCGVDAMCVERRVAGAFCGPAAR